MLESLFGVSVELKEAVERERDKIEEVVTDITKKEYNIPQI